MLLSLERVDMKRIIRSLLSAEPVLHVLVYRRLKTVCPQELPIELLGRTSCAGAIMELVLGKRLILIRAHKRTHGSMQNTSFRHANASTHKFSTSSFVALPALHCLTLR